MPSVSRRQQKAMFAAAEGNSTLGIPKRVGKDFAAADIARGPTRLPQTAKGLAQPKPSQRGIPKRRGIAKIQLPGDTDALPKMHTSSHH